MDLEENTIQAPASPESPLPAVPEEGSVVDSEAQSTQVAPPSPPIYKPRTVARQKKQPVQRRKWEPPKNEESLIGALCTWMVDHQIGIAMNLLLLLSLTHICFPRSRRHTTKFFSMSYYNEDSGRYGLGWDDVFMVFYWVVVLTGLRILVMEYVMVPFAEMGGIYKKKEKIRFAEQAWIFVYAGSSWSLGMYIMYHSDYWLKLENMWAGWPDREMDGLRKWYYLVQFAFWLQQIIVVNIEERRKDYVQMFTHHLITCALMLSSYGYHHTKIGNVILCIMDSVDIILPLAKMLNYMKFQTACDIAFGAFLITWLASRHIIYMLVVRSIYVDLPKHIEFGCYKGSNANLIGPFEAPDNLSYLVAPFFDPEGLVCQTETMQSMFVAMLLSLQVILLVWFAMIIRIAVRVIQGHQAEDIRSDDEGGEEAETESEKVVLKESGEDVTPRKQQRDYIQLPSCHGNDAVDFDAIATLNARKSVSPARRYKKAAGAASGVSLPHDTKELLGRIGCDKGA